MEGEPAAISVAGGTWIPFDNDDDDDTPEIDGHWVFLNDLEEVTSAEAPAELGEYARESLAPSAPRQDS